MSPPATEKFDVSLSNMKSYLKKEKKKKRLEEGSKVKSTNYSYRVLLSTPTLGSSQLPVTTAPENSIPI